MGLTKILFFLLPYILFAQNYPDNKLDSLLRNGIDFIINQQYDKAEENFKFLDFNYPKLPLGKIYLAAVQIAQSVDYASDFEDDVITEYLDSALELSELLWDSNEYDIWNNYFVALSLGYYAYYRALDGNFFLAFADGVSSIEYFDRCIQIDSLFTDAYIAIGTFAYWRSVKAEFLNWLPFVEDQKDIGLNLLQESVKSNSYNSYLAAYSLIWIFINEKKYNEAANIAVNALRSYPNSRYFKWGLARAFEDIDKYKAIEIYKEILDDFLSNDLNNPFNEIVLRHKIAMQYEALEETELALIECNNILNKPDISRELLDKLTDRIARVSEMKNRLTIMR